MKRVFLANKTSLSHALSIAPGLCAIVGSGGKTALMLRLAHELAEKGSVIVATSTHIYPPEGIPLITGSEAAIAQAFTQHRILCVGSFTQNGKLTAPELPFPQLATLADYVLVEADGARRLPLKAHAAHEPVIPDGARVIAVVGATGFGKPVAQAAHRPELYAKALGIGMDENVTPEGAAHVLKGDLPCDTVVVNQVDTNEMLAMAARFAQSLGSGTVIAAALREEAAVQAIWKG